VTNSVNRGTVKIERKSFQLVVLIQESKAKEGRRAEQLFELLIRGLWVTCCTVRSVKRERTCKASVKCLESAWRQLVCDQGRNRYGETSDSVASSSSVFSDQSSLKVPNFIAYFYQ
jgi:hypothetical protein